MAMGAGGAADPAGMGDVAYRLWVVLSAAEAGNPMMQFAQDLKGELTGTSAGGSNGALRDHLAGRLTALKQTEEQLLTQIQVKSHAKDRLETELRRFEATLEKLEQEKKTVRQQQRYTEVCLNELTQSESRLRLDLFSASNSISPSAPRRTLPSEAANPVLPQQVQEEPNGHVPTPTAGPPLQGRAGSGGESDETKRIEAVLWHLGNKQSQEANVRQSLRDFDAYCAGLVEQPWVNATYPAWVRCTNVMLTQLQQTQTLPVLQALILRCLSEIVKRWNTALHARVALPEPSVIDLVTGGGSGLEYIAKLLQSVNEDVKTETAFLITNVSIDIPLKDAFARVGCIQALVQILRRPASEYLWERALTCLWHLAMSDRNKAIIREAGGLAAIVDLLHSDSEVVLENVTIALGYLTRDDANKVAIRQCNGLERLIATLYYPSDSIQSKAAGALWNCASNTENKVVIRQLGAMSALIELLHSRNESVQENAAGGLWNCAVDSENKRLVRELGGLQPLIQLLSSPVESVVENASGTLWNCAAVTDNRVLIRKLGGLDPLLRLLKSPNENIQENAAGAIRNCAIHDQNKVALRDLGAIEVFVSLLDKTKHTVLEKLTSTLWICSINNDNKNLIRTCDGFPRLLRILDDTNQGIREKSLGILRNCSTLPENRQPLIQCGVIRKLTQLLNQPEKLSSPMKEYCAATLWNVARDDKVTAREEGAVIALVRLLSDKTDSVVENAAGSLLSLTLAPENRDHVREIGGIQELVRCLGVKSEFILEHVVGAIKNCVSSNEANQALVRDLDAIPRLIGLLKHQTENVVREATLALKNLAQDNECSDAIGRLGGCAELARMVSQNSADGIRKVAGFALQALAKNPHNRALIPPDLVSAVGSFR
eukprot:Hpha_TRINITY_DN16636_c3_g9::TRINITY_DN16636_c3_g9_i1::g.182110::m.182110